jgi:hypothetical protein
LVSALDGLAIGESLWTAQQILGKPQPAVFRQLPALQWKRPSGLVITVLTGKDGNIVLVDETAAAGDQPTAYVEENSRETDLVFNQDSHTNVNSALQAPGTAGCKSSFGADCWEYQYDRGIVLRADFAPNGAADGVLRELTLADPSLLKQLHFGE